MYLSSTTKPLLIKMNKKLAYKSGKISELLAKSYLLEQGWKVIKTNYKTPYGEIDILASKEDSLVAFEVKYRKNPNLLFYCIKSSQQKRINCSLLWFISEHPAYSAFDLRVDVILVQDNNLAVDAQAKSITHLENAWQDHTTN